MCVTTADRGVCAVRYPVCGAMELRTGIVHFLRNFPSKTWRIAHWGKTSGAGQCQQGQS